MRIVTLFLIITFLSACRPPINKKNNVDCEIPVVECEQTPWTGTPLDTTYYNSGKNYYYSIEQVIGLNTSDQEYSIMLSDVVHPKSNQQINFATIGEELGQRTYLIENEIDKNSNTKSSHSFRRVMDIKGDSEGHFGFPTIVNKERIVIASTYESAPRKYGDNDIIPVELAPLEETIGQSRLYDVKKGADKQVETDITSKYSHLIWESHPSFDKRNNILFFSSDRENGFGGVDLWYMVLKNGDWDGPYNCGINVNSACDDITPYPSPDGNRLYFSSSAHNSVGGYDLFYIDYIVENQSEPMPIFDKSIHNVGAPINTVADEISPFFKDNSDNYFYYSSDQDGDFDIYVKQKIFKDGRDIVRNDEKEIVEENIEVELPKDSIDVNPKFELEGVVTDKRTQEPIEDVDVTVTKEKETTPYKQTKTDKDGKYKFELDKGPEYNVKVEDDTLFYEQYTVKVDRRDTATTVNRDITMDIIKTVRINFEYDKSNKPYEYILDSLGNQENVTWQTAIDNLTDDIKGSQSVLEKVIITGHTDPVASAAYNKNLGQKRAEFVVSELVKRGIPIYLLKAKSKGETEKLKKFSNEDTKQYHKRLRRVTLEKVFIK